MQNSNWFWCKNSLRLRIYIFLFFILTGIIILDLNIIRTQKHRNSLNLVAQKIFLRRKQKASAAHAGLVFLASFEAPGQRSHLLDPALWSGLQYLTNIECPIKFMRTFVVSREQILQTLTLRKMTRRHPEFFCPATCISKHLFSTLPDGSCYQSMFHIRFNQNEVNCPEQNSSITSVYFPSQLQTHTGLVSMSAYELDPAWSATEITAPA